MKTTVLQKGLALVTLPLVFQFLFVLAAWRLQRAHADAERWAAHTKEVLARAHEARSAAADAHAAVRGYVITRDPAGAAELGRARADLPGHLDALADLVKDNPGQGARVEAIRARADALRAWQGEVEGLVRGGAADAATERVRSGGGRERWDAFREAVGAFVAEEQRLDRAREDALARSRERLNALFVVGGAAAAGGTLALALVFRRRVARRFAALERNARLLAARAPLPPPLGGDDEIARLDRAFRDMAAELTRAADAVRDLYDNAPCGYHSVGADGILVAVNRTELGWLGYSADELVGRARFADLVAPPSRAAYRAAFDRLRDAGAVANVELELLRKDGTTLPVLAASTAIRDAAGRYLHSRTTLTDLTERHRAESAARQFADLARHIPVGLLTYQLGAPGPGPVLRVRSGNAEAVRLLGLELDEIVGRTAAEAFPAAPPELLRRFATVAATGAPDDLGEYQYGDARVADRWWAAQAFPLPDRCVGVAFRDVSDRRRAEDEVRRLNAELERRVHERTAELEAANRELAEKNAENEMFVYSVSHDLRSPLVNLQGFSKELEKGCRQLAGLLAEPGVPDDVRDRGQALADGRVAKAAGFIQAAVLRLGGIIDALLRLSRAGRVEYRWEVLDVAALAGRVVAAAQGTIADRGAAVRVGELPPAWGDRTAVEQVLGNLVGNALTYLDPARPGLIEVGHVAAESAAGSGSNTYFVRDNGLGIAEGHRQKIFQPFQRAHPGVGSGEGLGLAIVARVVERHRGRVWVESRPGEGSTFYFTLPAPPAGGG